MVSISAPPNSVDRLRPAAGSIVLAALWFVLAWRSPGSTHHFAPFVVAAAWGFLSSIPTRSAAVMAAAAGVVVASATTVALAAFDRLQGPTLWGTRPSWPELLGFGLLGGLVTLVKARKARPRR